MGEPESSERFVRLEADDLTIHISSELWDALKTNQSKLLVAIPGYGRFWLHIEATGDQGNRTG